MHHLLQQHSLRWPPFSSVQRTWLAGQLVSQNELCESSSVCPLPSLLQHAWLAAQLVSQWVGPEGAVDDAAVRHWAPVADVIKEACRCGQWPAVA